MAYIFLKEGNTKDLSPYSLKKKKQLKKIVHKTPSRKFTKEGWVFLKQNVLVLGKLEGWQADTGADPVFMWTRHFHLIDQIASSLPSKGFLVISSVNIAQNF